LIIIEYCSAKDKATARPIPREAPVIKAYFMFYWLLIILK
jgi:hypothetical protein